MLKIENAIERIVDGFNKSETPDEFMDTLGIKVTRSSTTLYTKLYDDIIKEFEVIHFEETITTDQFKEAMVDQSFRESIKEVLKRTIELSPKHNMNRVGSYSSSIGEEEEKEKSFEAYLNAHKRFFDQMQP